jgi:peptide/nickel transport system substrate-binding protein
MRLTFFLLVAISVLAFGCGGGGGSKDSAGSNRVVEHILSDMERLNPFNSTGANETYIEEQIFERLLRIDVKTMRYDIPWLADSVPIESPDHMQFDFRIRHGVKFADGKELTGNDVVFSLKALKNPYNVMSAQKRTYVDYIHSAELIDGDPYRVRFKMWKPYYLVKQAAFGDVLYIIPKHIFDPQNISDKYSWEDISAIVETQEGADLDSATLAKKKANPAMREFADWFTKTETGRDPKFVFGSGPYKLKQWITSDRIVLERNPHYTNKGNSAYGEANPNELIYKVINDWNSAVTAVKSRDIDFLGFLQPAYYVKIDTVELKHISKTTFPLPSYALIGWNHKNPIFKEQKVRLALAHLIDRKTIIDKVLYGYAKETQSPVFFGKPEYNGDLPLIPYDPEKAKAMLKEAGWEDHNGDGVLDKTIGGKKVDFDFTFLVNAGNDTRKQILLIIAESLRKVGIKAEVQAIEWTVFLDRLRDHNFDARYGSWQSDPYENDSYQLYHSSQAKNRGSNYDGWASPRADALLEAIRKELDETKRYEMQREFQRVYYEEQPEACMWVPENPTVWVNRFDNVWFYSVRPGYNQAWWKVRGAGPSKKESAAF